MRKAFGEFSFLFFYLTFSVATIFYLATIKGGSNRCPVENTVPNCSAMIDPYPQAKIKI